MTAIGKCVRVPFSGFGYPRFCHLCHDTGEYRRGGFLVTILDCHNFLPSQKCRNETVLF